MPLHGHWERQNRRVLARERRTAMAVAAAAALAAVVVAIVAIGTGPSRSERGCIDVLAASTTGGATLHACGGQAAQWCRAELPRAGRARAAGERACRAAGYAR